MDPTYVKELRGNILVVDDNVVNRILLKKVLKKWGLKTQFAENGREALDLLQSSDSFHIVLMDIHMPVMNGMEAAAVIRAHPNPSIAKLPLIALTATILNEDLKSLFDAGFDDYIIQPFDQYQLYQLLDERLSAIQAH